jgi:hypothetical protein
VQGWMAKLGRHEVQLAGEPRISGTPKLELGVRPEFVRVGAQGMPATITRVEDAGRLKIVRAEVDGIAVTAVLQEGAEIPADAFIAFDPAGVHLYGDSWLIGVGSEAGAFPVAVETVASDAAPDVPDASGAVAAEPAAGEPGEAPAVAVAPEPKMPADGETP